MGYISEIRKKVGHDPVFMPVAACGILQNIRFYWSVFVSGIWCKTWFAWYEWKGCVDRTYRDFWCHGFFLQKRWKDTYRWWAFLSGISDSGTCEGVSKQQIWIWRDHLHLVIRALAAAGTIGGFYRYFRRYEKSPGQFCAGCHHESAQPQYDEYAPKVYFNLVFLWWEAGWHFNC